MGKIWWVIFFGTSLLLYNADIGWLEGLGGMFLNVWKRIACFGRGPFFAEFWGEDPFEAVEVWCLRRFSENSMEYHSGKLTWLAGKWTRIEDVFPIENGGYSIAMLVFTRGYSKYGSSDYHLQYLFVKEHTLEFHRRAFDLYMSLQLMDKHLGKSITWD